LIDLPITCFSGGTLEIYIEPQYPPPRLLVVGTLPAARALVSLGKVMDYDVIVVDAEGQAASQADRVLTNLADMTQHIRPETYVVVATHGNFDEAALEHVLKARPRYIGLVASRKRFEAVVEYLRGQGVDEAALKRIKAPAGLDIHAQQGDEIAVSILAEIIQVRRTAPTADDWGSLVTQEMPAPAAVSGVAIDPVCRMEVEMATAQYTYDYEGKTYYFCSPGCKTAFSKNPLDYLKAEPGIAIDPVCGMNVDTASAHYTSDYQGTIYYFCSPGCKLSFDQNPEAFLAASPESKPDL
ncbi:MAG TPA: YHS domain-containing protein, partial [Aggregatilineales bacterium]|nr:YHS domain-containing protein [Aggregatilineales bacterium]